MTPTELDRMVEQPEAPQRAPITLGYARVSTHTQAEKGTSLADQTRRLRAAGAIDVRTDAGISGKSIEGRDALRALVWGDSEQGIPPVLQPGDTLLVTAIDRLGRSTRDVLAVAGDLRERGVSLRSLREGVDFSTPTGQLVLTVMAALAQMEREQILERTARGREAAMGKGGGQRVWTKEREIRAAEMLAAGLTPDEIARALEVSLSTLYRHCDALHARIAKRKQERKRAALIASAEADAAIAAARGEIPSHPPLRKREAA